MMVALALLLAAVGLPVMAATPVDLLEAELGGQRVVLLGEMHGTQEIPRITFQLTERYAKAGPVLLCLEADPVDQVRVDRFFASDGGPEAQSRLLEGVHWQDAMHDGRDSLAMFELLDGVRRLRAGGAAVDVVLFDAPGDGERDARMAAVVREAILSRPDARMLVLTGNVHAMTGPPPSMSGPDGEPIQLPTTLGRHLADLSPLSIEFRAGHGDFWICKGDDCGVHPVMQVREVAEPALTRNPEGASWAMTMLLPRFTASPPAIGAE